MDTLKKNHYLFELEERVKHLEEVNRRISFALELADSFGDLQVSINPNQEHDKILNMTRLHLKRLMQFRTLAFLMVDESDFDFVLTGCEPESDRLVIQKELDFQITEGTFAWAVHQNRSVTVPAKNFKQPLVLHSMVTPSRVMGMFVGVLMGDEYVGNNVLSNLLTLILFSSANALENSALYKKINDQNRNLEEMIQKRTEELKRALEETKVASTSKSQFLANISHEIRTPINAMNGFTDMLLDTYLNEEQTDYVNILKSNGEALLSLIDDILDFSKMEARQLDLEKIDFNPERMVYDICELIKPKISKKPIEILCRIGDHVPPQVKGDSHRFRQVLVNLIGNAAKFTEAGEIEISTDIENEKENHIELHVTVRDTGPGIPKHKLATIFEPFQQADGSTTRNYGGTGLGLSICKEISKMMDGDVWGESELHQGSRFHFTAWLEKSEHQQVQKFPFFSRGKILIVDDSPTHLEILTRVMKSTSLRVTVLMQGEEVVSTLQKAFERGDPFDLCFIDLQLSRMNGYEMAKQIRRSHFPNLFLIALSASFERDVLKDEEAGFDGLLSKPIRKEKLFHMIERLIGGVKREEPKGKVAENKMDRCGFIGGAKKQSSQILLVEDNPVNQRLSAKIFEKLGFSVDTAKNGLEAVEMVNKRSYDMVFMDCQMPKIDGYEATTMIRRLENPFQHTPIIAMTAHVIKGERERCLAAGMDDYLSKPIKKERIFEMIQKWMGEGRNGVLDEY